MVQPRMHPLGTVDSCRVWESHTEAGFHRNGRDEINPKFLRMISQVASDAQPQLRARFESASRRLSPVGNHG